MRIDGLWHDATAAHKDRIAGKEQPPSAYEEPETVHLSPLPCWQHLSQEAHRDRVAEMVQEIERETRERHRSAETAPTGAHFVVACDPHEKPRKMKRSPAPAFHAASRKAWERLREAYLRFVVAYRDAAERLRRGERAVVFPRGCFPPALPFVPG